MPDLSLPLPALSALEAGSIPAPATTDVLASDRGRIQKCAAQHFGPWFIETAWFERAVAAVKAGIWVVPAPKNFSLGGDEEAPPVAYRLTEDGIAVLSIEGPMHKGDSSFGGTSTVRTRQALRQALRDPQMRGIMILGDSPGGTVAGTAELAADVAAAARRVPLHVHIEDLGASAMFYVAAQARYLTACASSLIGSIGTVAVVEDSSGEMAKEGIVVHVVSTGPYKGAFTPGAPVSEDHLKYLQGYVNAFGEQFVAAVAAGRRVPVDRVRGWADGRIHLAETARAMGMIDAVCGQDEAFAALRQELANPKKGSVAMWNPIRALLGASKAEPVVEAVAIAAATAASPAPAPAPAAAAPRPASTPPEQPEAVDTKARFVVADAPAAAPAAPGAAGTPPGPQVLAAAPDGPPAGHRDVGVVLELSLSDRATVEAELLANLKRFMEAFGPAGAAWFATGKTFEEAQALHAAAVVTERDRLTKEVADLKARIAADRGSPTPVSFSAGAEDSPAAAASRDLAAKIGPNLARVAAGLKFARKD